MQPDRRVFKQTDSDNILYLIYSSHTQWHLSYYAHYTPTRWDQLNNQTDTIGSRTFKVAAAQTWIGLPEDVTSSPTLPIFIRDFKLVCFADLILTLFLYLTCCTYPHSGFEVALLLRPFKIILIDCLIDCWVVANVKTSSCIRRKHVCQMNGW